MRLCTTGPRIAIHDIRELEFLAAPLRYQIRTYEYASATAAEAAFDAFEQDLTARTAGEWIVELRRASFCRNVATMAPWADYMSGSLALTPRLVDPTDLGERAARARTLLDAFGAPGLDIEPLHVVDWAMRPAVRDFVDAAVDLAAGKSSLLDVATSRYDLSKLHWPAIRQGRRALLGPWFGGRFPVLDHETFTALHDRLPDELAFIAAQVADGSHYTYDHNLRPEISELVRVLIDQKFVRQISVARTGTTISRHRRVASRLLYGESLDIA